MLTRNQNQNNIIFINTPFKHNIIWKLIFKWFCWWLGPVGVLSHQKTSYLNFDFWANLKQEYDWNWIKNMAKYTQICKIKYEGWERWAPTSCDTHLIARSLLNVVSFLIVVIFALALFIYVAKAHVASILYFNLTWALRHVRAIALLLGWYLWVWVKHFSPEIKRVKYKQDTLKGYRTVLCWAGLGHAWKTRNCNFIYE